MARVLITALFCVLLTAELVLGAEKQIKLEDIERDNLSAKQKQQQQRQQPQKQQQPQPQQPQAQPEQPPPSAPAYTGQPEGHPEQQQLHYQQQQQQHILLQHLQAYQPQYQAPPTGGALALYPAAFLAGNQLGIPHDVVPAAYLAPQHGGAHAPGFPQQFYLPQGGYQGLQFVQAQPAPIIYTNQVPAEIPKGTAQTAQAPAPKEIPSAPSAVPQQQPAHAPQPQNLQQAKNSAPVPTPNAGAADPNFAYTPQQNYNPIPKELQSYTTIPESVYQGKEPDYLYEQQPAISLTNEQFNPYNTLYQQPTHQRPIFSPGVKTAVPQSLKGFPSGPSFFGRNSFLGPSRHFPGAGISYSSYRQGPGAF
ncbi:hypothetical protein C0J52_25874 [Blattella germanica]|nr:hypothetical protein C0J52_25874 [Blattella germanica]